MFDRGGYSPTRAIGIIPRIRHPTPLTPPGVRRSPAHNSVTSTVLYFFYAAKPFSLSQSFFAAGRGLIFCSSPIEPPQRYGRSYPCQLQDIFRRLDGGYFDCSNSSRGMLSPPHSHRGLCPARRDPPAPFISFHHLLFSNLRVVVFSLCFDFLSHTCCELISSQRWC